LLPQSFDLVLLLLDLRLLLLDGVDQDHADLVVFDALDLAVAVVRHEQRFDLGDFFGDEAKIVLPSLLPVECDGPKPFDHVQPADERQDVFLVDPARRAQRQHLAASANLRSGGVRKKTDRNRIEAVPAELDSIGCANNRTRSDRRCKVDRSRTADLIDFRIRTQQSVVSAEYVLRDDKIGVAAR